MKFFEIEIENFRQYSGKNSIILSTDDQKNFTIIQGANGSGKSNFLNAITWCLYGDEIHFTSKEGKRKILNESIANDMPSGSSIHAAVSIVIGDKKPEYKFQRKASFYKNGKFIQDEKIEFLAYRITSDKGWVRDENPDWLVEQKLIPQKLRDFFFFDGEKMDSFFRSTKDVKQNVERIAQIDVLNSMISNLKALERTYNKQLNKVNPKYADLNDRRMTLSDEIQLKEDEKKEVQGKIDQYDYEISQIDQFLQNNSDVVVKGLQTERDQCKVAITRYQDNLKTVKEDINNLLSSLAPLVFGSTAINDTIKIIERETEKGVLPPEIKDVFLEDLLKKGVCICGRTLDVGTECRASVENLLKKTVPNDIAMDAVEGRYALDSMYSKIGFEEKYTKLLRKELELSNELISLNGNLERISETLKNYNSEEIAEKEKRRREAKADRDRLLTRKGVLGNAIVSRGHDLEEIEKMISQEEHNAKSRDLLYLQMEKVNSVASHTQRIKDEIIEDVRKTLEKKTQEYFLNMIWKKDAFSSVSIVDDGKEYRISVLSKLGNSCLGDLSAGERQVLALSFTAALYEVSGFNVPVVIDTPLGRISDLTSEKIAEALPKYLSTTQVTILATDKEYSEAVRSRLIGSVGKEYKIEYDENSRTAKVKEYGR